MAPHLAPYRAPPQDPLTQHSTGPSTGSPLPYRTPTHRTPHRKAALGAPELTGAPATLADGAGRSFAAPWPRPTPSHTGASLRDEQHALERSPQLPVDGAGLLRTERTKTLVSSLGPSSSGLPALLTRGVGLKWPTRSLGPRSAWWGVRERTHPRDDDGGQGRGPSQDESWEERQTQGGEEPGG